LKFEIKTYDMLNFVFETHNTFELSKKNCRNITFWKTQYDQYKKHYYHILNIKDIEWGTLFKRCKLSQHLIYSKDEGNSLCTICRNFRILLGGKNKKLQPSVIHKHICTCNFALHSIRWLKVHTRIQKWNFKLESILEKHMYKLNLARKSRDNFIVIII